MKKYWFGIVEAILSVLLILWIVFTLNFYQAVDLNLGLPTADSISNGSSTSSVAPIGATLLVIGIGGLIAYMLVMFAFYFSKAISKTILFWLNIAFFSIFLVATILGLLFVNLPL